MKITDYLEEQLKDPEFAKVYKEVRAERLLAQRLVEERKHQNLSQRELAKRAGIRQSHLCRFESGEHTPSFEFVRKVASGLGKTINYIVE